MNQLKSRFLLPLFAVVFTAAVSFGVSAVAQTFSEPSAAPPSNNAYAPLDTGPNANSKVGGLLLNSGGAANGLIVQSGNVGIGITSPTQKLDVSGYVKGTGLCIGADCRTAWPSAGTGSVTSIGTGAGLTGGPITTTGTISVNTAAISTCTGATQKIIWDSANSRFTCATDADTNSGGDITGVTAGTGLTGGGTTGTVTLSADTNYLQRRVSGSCAAGSSIRVVNADGTVACETDDNTTITSYNQLPSGSVAGYGLVSNSYGTIVIAPATSGSGSCAAGWTPIRTGSLNDDPSSGPASRTVYSCIKN